MEKDAHHTQRTGLKHGQVMITVDFGTLATSGDMVVVSQPVAKLGDKLL